MSPAAELARLTLRQGRRGTLGWIVGLALLTALYTASYRSISGAKASAIDSYPASVKQALNLQDLTTSTGYLNSTTFGIPLLLLASIYVIVAATRAVAGDEESGALDLLLSYPVSRRGLIVARMGSIVGVLVAFGVAVFIIVAVLRGPTGLSVGTGNLVAATFTWLLMGCCLAAISLLVSASVGNRSAALGISAGLTLFAYLADSFLPLIPQLGWIHNISPFYWFIGGDPLANGLQTGHSLLLLATTVVATALAAVAFERRDLGV